MKKMLFLLLSLVLKVYDSAAIDACDPFFFKWCHHHAGMFTVGILKEDYDLNYNFQLQITNHDKIHLKSNLSYITERQNDLFKISLNANGTGLLEKKRLLPLCSHVYVKMKILNKKMHCGGPPPSIQKLTIGDRKCQVPTQPSQSAETIEHLKTCKQICSVCPRADLVGEIGFKINLDVTVLWAYNIMIAFKEDVEELNIVARTEQFKYATWTRIDTGCNKLHHFRLTFTKLLNRYAVIEMFFKTKKRGKVPSITYIYYGNKKCNTYCGSNPCAGGDTKETTNDDTVQSDIATANTVADIKENIFKDIEDLQNIISDDNNFYK